MRRDFIVGVDLAKKFDRSFFVGLERTPLDVPPPADDAEAPEEDPLLLRAFGCLQVPQGTPYGAVADHAALVAADPHFRGRVQFALDVTGVGEAVLELFEQRPELDGLVWAVTISPGQRVNRKFMRWSVPKKDLVDATLVALQRRRLIACPHDPYHMDVLRQQLFAFKRKVDPRTLVASYEAISESVHDDGATALCLAAWLSSQLPLEDQGEDDDSSVPHTVLGGATALPRPTPSWRTSDDPATHRPAGTGPQSGDAGLPPRPNRPPTPRD